MKIKKRSKSNLDEITMNLVKNEIFRIKNNCKDLKNKKLN